MPIKKSRIGRREHTGQAGIPFRINWRSPQAAGLMACYPPGLSVGSSVLRDGRGRLDGTITGATWANDPVMGYCLEFDGSSTKVEIADSPVWDVSDAISVAFWCKPRTLAAYDIPICRWDENISRIWSCGIASAGGDLRGDTSHNGLYHAENVVTASGVLSANQWAHVVLTSDPVANVNRIYIDGGLAATKTGITGGLVDTTLSVWIGYSPKWGGVANQHWDGWIGDVRMYDRVLGAVEIQHLYNPITRWDLYRPPRRAFTGQGPGTMARVSQIGLEVLLDPIAEAYARVSQVGLEVLAQTQAPSLAQVTQLVLEVLGEPPALSPPNARITQVVLEVLGSLSAPTPPSTSSTSSDETARYLVRKLSWPR